MRSRLPGAADAEVAGPSALILELVESRWLAEAGVACGSGCRRSRAGLVDVDVQHFARQRQVANRRPSRARTNLPDAEVRIVEAASRDATRNSRADERRCGVVVA